MSSAFESVVLVSPTTTRHKSSKKAGAKKRPSMTGGEDLVGPAIISSPPKKQQTSKEAPVLRNQAHKPFLAQLPPPPLFGPHFGIENRDAKASVATPAGAATTRVVRAVTPTNEDEPSKEVGNLTLPDGRRLTITMGLGEDHAGSNVPLCDDTKLKKAQKDGKKPASADPKPGGLQKSPSSSKGKAQKQAKGGEKNALGSKKETATNGLLPSRKKFPPPKGSRLALSVLHSRKEQTVGNRVLQSLITPQLLQLFIDDPSSRRSLALGLMASLESQYTVKYQICTRFGNGGNRKLVTLSDAEEIADCLVLMLETRAFDFEQKQKAAKRKEIKSVPCDSRLESTMKTLELDSVARGHAETLHGEELETYLRLCQLREDDVDGALDLIEMPPFPVCPYFMLSTKETEDMDETAVSFGVIPHKSDGGDVAPAVFEEDHSMGLSRFFDDDELEAMFGEQVAKADEDDGSCDSNKCTALRTSSNGHEASTLPIDSPDGGSINFVDSKLLEDDLQAQDASEKNEDDVEGKVEELVYPLPGPLLLRRSSSGCSQLCRTHSFGSAMSAPFAPV